MRFYENLMILKPDVTEEAYDQFVATMRDLIESHEGTLDEVDKWGIRNLAYRVDKFDQGFYLLLRFHSKADLVEEMERRLRVADLVIKFLTTRLDLRQKRVEKRKKARADRESRKPAPQAPAPPPAPAEPSGEEKPAPAAPGLPQPGGEDQEEPQEQSQEQPDEQPQEQE